MFEYRKVCISSSGTYTSALMTQSRSSAPSSGPLGPPWVARNSLGRHSTPSSARLAASSRWRSSIFVFSSVAASWSRAITALTVLCQSLCDSRSPCSSSGRLCGGLCFECDALNRRCFSCVYTRPVSHCSGRRIGRQRTWASLIYISPFHRPESS